MPASSDIEIAKPFVQATIHVLSTMASITPIPGKPYVKQTPAAQGDVSAIVGFTGVKNGSVAVSFTKPCAVCLVRGMLGDDIQDLLQDVKDAVGEITNMISGQARSSLAEAGLLFQGSTPSVLVGDQHAISHKGDGAIIAIPFTSDAGEFTVEFCFEK